MTSKHWTHHKGMNVVVEPPEQRCGLHESEALVTAVIIQEVISARVVEFDPTTVDSRTDQAVLVVSVVVDWSASKWKSHSP